MVTTFSININLFKIIKIINNLFYQINFNS